MRRPHSSQGDKTDLEQRDFFVSTCWTAILQAQRESPEAREALERLCDTYWYPLYAYVRHRGYNPSDAEDLTQGFFEFFLQNERVRVVDRRKGKFRSFLLTAMKGYLANHWNYVHAAKRGGQKLILSLDERTAEERYALEPVDEATPAELFERRWAAEMFQRTLDRLQEEHVILGKTELFDHLRAFLIEDTRMNDYKPAATALNMTPNAVAVAVYRLRQRYRKLLRDEIARTVSSPKEIEEEMRYLFNVLSRS